MSRPSVSVIMPCYNARNSLPWALGSLLAQTYEDWELVLADDGSSDHPEEIVEQAADERFRLIRLPENRGRGHARQAALDNARAEFIAMLDADDWMLPTRIDVELRLLNKEPTLTLVSSGMAIVDSSNELVGVRAKGNGELLGPFRGLRLPVAFATSMFRRDHLRGVRFDSTLRTIEDVDFILRLLHGRQYAVLPSIEYVYAELASVTAHRAAEGQRLVRRHARLLRSTYPGEYVKLYGASLLKELVYRGAEGLGMGARLVQRRSTPPSPKERDAFHRGREVVRAVVRERFGDGQVVDPAADHAQVRRTGDEVPT